MILIKLVRETRLRENRSIHGDRFFPVRTLLSHLALYVDFSYTEVTRSSLLLHKNTGHSQLVIFAETSKHAIVLFPSINA